MLVVDGTAVGRQRMRCWWWMGRLSAGRGCDVGGGWDGCRQAEDAMLVVDGTAVGRKVWMSTLSAGT